MEISINNIKKVLKIVEIVQKYGFICTLIVEEKEVYLEFEFKYINKSFADDIVILVSSDFEDSIYCFEWSEDDDICKLIFNLNLRSCF